MPSQQTKLRIAGISLSAICLVMSAGNVLAIDLKKLTEPRTPMGPGLDYEFSRKLGEYTAMVPPNDPFALDGGVVSSNSINPARSMLLAFLALAVSPQSIAILNGSNTELKALYFDPNSATWKEFAISRDKPVIVECSKCSAVVKLSFHNGLIQQTADVVLGAKLIVSLENSPWVLKPLASYFSQIGN